MTRTQMLYNKLMKVFYLLSLIFMLLFLTVLASGVVNGSVNCKLPDSTSTFCIDNQALIYQYSLGLFFTLMFVFLIGARIFYELVHHERDLISVAEYRKSLELQQKRLDENAISKEQLYNRLKSGRTESYEEKGFISSLKDTVQQLLDNIVVFIKSVPKKVSNYLENLKSIRENKKQEKDAKKAKELQFVHKESIEKHEQRSKGRMNKLELVLLAANDAKLEETKVRAALNAFIQIIIENISRESIEIEDFGKFDIVAFNSENDVVFFPSEKFIYNTIGVKIENIKEKTTKTENVVEKPTKTEEKRKIDKKVIIEAITKAEKELAKEEKEIHGQAKKVEERPKVKITSTLTKTALIELMESTTELSKNKAYKFLNALTLVLTEELKERRKIEFSPIGHFETIEMPAKDAVNPQTKKAIVVPAHHQVRFRFNSDFKKLINQPKKAE